MCNFSWLFQQSSTISRKVGVTFPDLHVAEFIVLVNVYIGCTEQSLVMQSALISLCFSCHRWVCQGQSWQTQVDGAVGMSLVLALLVIHALAEQVYFWSLSVLKCDFIAEKYRRTLPVPVWISYAFCTSCKDPCNSDALKLFALDRL